MIESGIAIQKSQSVFHICLFYTYLLMKNVGFETEIRYELH